MKIIFYINAIHHGGAERVMTNLTKELSDEIECVLVTSFVDDWEYPVCNKVKRINLIDRVNNNFIKRNIELISRLRKVIKQEKPDIVLSFMAEPNFRNIIASIGLKNRTIISIRNDPNREYPNTLFKMTARILYPLATGVVFQTRDAQKWFSKKIENKSKIIYNPVDNVFYEERYYGERRNIVTTGRLTEQKNHSMLIKAFASISHLIDENLVIYGDGELREQLEQLIKNLKLEGRVFLPGAVKNVADEIKNAKLFVLSSDYEGMPNSLMEAMALGLPCFSTDCPCGGPRLLLDEVYLTPVGDADALGKKMLNLLSDSSELLEASKSCISNAELFKSEKVYKEWRSFLWKYR